MCRTVGCNAISVEAARGFGETYCLRLQSRRVCQAVNQEKRLKLRLPPVSIISLLPLLFIPKDGGNIFIRNVGLYPKYKALQRRRLLSIATCMRTQNPIQVVFMSRWNIICLIPTNTQLKWQLGLEYSLFIVCPKYRWVCSTYIFSIYRFFSMFWTSSFHKT